MPKITKVDMVGYGVFKTEHTTGLWVWDDYPDDREHKGYGCLRNADGVMHEIVKIERDEEENIVAMELEPFYVEV